MIVLVRAGAVKAQSIDTVGFLRTIHKGTESGGDRWSMPSRRGHDPVIRSGEIRGASCGPGFTGLGHRVQLVMITAGLIFLLLGALLSIPLLWTIGVVLLIVGLVLMLLGRSGRQVGGRAHYW